MDSPPTMPRDDVLRVKLELLQREHRISTTPSRRSTQGGGPIR